MTTVQLLLQCTLEDCKSACHFAGSKRKLPHESESLLHLFHWSSLVDLDVLENIRNGAHKHQVSHSSQQTHGITSITACKGPRLTKSRPVSTIQDRIMKIQAPRREINRRPECSKGVFCIRILASDLRDKQIGRLVPGSTLHSADTNDRLKAAGTVWKCLRASLSKIVRIEFEA